MTPEIQIIVAVLTCRFPKAYMLSLQQDQAAMDTTLHRNSIKHNIRNKIRLQCLQILYIMEIKSFE